MDKRKQIQDAALRLFVELGFHGTPTSMIAKEAGVANGTLFHYFATKDELVIALYVAIKNQMAGHIAEHAKGGQDFRETLREQYLLSVFWALEHPLEFRFTEQFKTSPFLMMIAPKEVEASLKPYYDMLQKGMDAQIIKSRPPELLFSLISSQTYGLNQYLLGQQQMPGAKLHQVISDAFDMLWAMIT